MATTDAPPPPVGAGFAALDPCVHCGFCLPACPTYLATGDENDSPRGRIVLMRALQQGEVPPDDPALRQHLDACLGCRGCEPVCPSGVGYGEGLEAAREVLHAAVGHPWMARMVLGTFARRALWRPILMLSALLRRIGRRHLGRIPGSATAMLSATRPVTVVTAGTDPVPARGTVALFRGCVMDTLFRHVHTATRRALRENGYRVIDVPGQGCCGALHAHAGDRTTARRLAQNNIAMFQCSAAEMVVVNSAGCGAQLKAYDRLVEGGGDAFGTSVRDVTELLASVGPVETSLPRPLRIAYDAPCHLQHAQGVHEAPLQLLRAIRGSEITLVPGADRCCGSAGVYSLLEPEMSQVVLAAKVSSILAMDPRPDVIATGNPGCIMQIGAGLQRAGSAIPVVHPVEILAWGYTGADPIEAAGIR